MTNIEKKLKELLNEQSEIAFLTQDDTKKMKMGIDEALKSGAPQRLSRYRIKRKKMLVAIVVIIALVIGSIAGAHNDWLSEKMEQIGDSWFKYGFIRRDILEESNDRTIAVVNESVITQSQLKIAMLDYEFGYKLKTKDFIENIENYKMIAEDYGIPLDDLKPAKKSETDLLVELIDREILYQEAVKQGVALTMDEVREMAYEGRKMTLLNVWSYNESEINNGEHKTMEDFELYLISEGITWKEYEQQIMLGVMFGEIGKMLEGLELTYDEYYDGLLPIQQKLISGYRLIEKVWEVDDFSYVNREPFDKEREEFIAKYLKSLKKSGNYTVEVLK